MRLRSAMRYLSIGCNCLIRLVAGAWFLCEFVSFGDCFVGDGELIEFMLDTLV